MVVYVSDPSYMEGVDSRIVVWGQPWAKTREPIPKNKWSKKGLGS
jgi:hypothetical protein